MDNGSNNAASAFLIGAIIFSGFLLTCVAAARALSGF
jgi:hypothetical protein